MATDLPRDPRAWLDAIVARYGEPDWERVLITSIRFLDEAPRRDLLRACLASADPVERTVGAVALTSRERDDSLGGDPATTRAWLELLLDGLATQWSTPEHGGSPTELAFMTAAVALWTLGRRAPDELARAIAGRDRPLRCRALAACCEMPGEALVLVRTVYLEWTRLALGDWRDLAAPVLRAIQSHEGVGCYPWLVSLGAAGLAELSAAARQLVVDLDRDAIDVGPGDRDPAGWILAVACDK